MNLNGSSAQHPRNCSRVMNIAHHSARSFPSPRLALPAATPESTLTRLTCQRSPRSRTRTRSSGARMNGAGLRCDMTCSSRCLLMLKASRRALADDGGREPWRSNGARSGTCGNGPGFVAPAQ